MGLDYRVRCCPDGLMTDRRRSVKVLDCTIRDGGLCNDWRFDEALVKDTFEALVASGIDCMELGYLTTPGTPGVAGPWRESRPEDVARVARKTKMKLAAMVDVGRVRLEDLPRQEDSLFDVIRVATYAKDIDEAVELCNAAQELGYETFCNVMAVTTNTPQEVDHFLEVLRASSVQNVVVVDSFGAMYPHHVRYLIRKYKNWLRPDQAVGVHLHNNQETAFANSIAAIDEGVDWVDATLFGMGRGAGNCPLELLLMYLDSPDHDVRPVLSLIDRYAALRDELRWGYHVPYAISGWLNLHPKQAIERMKRAPDVGALDFWESLVKNRTPLRHHEARKE
jgi:4-hydroxy 2-oxovalerate aldolase